METGRRITDREWQRRERERTDLMIRLMEREGLREAQASALCDAELPPLPTPVPPRPKPPKTANIT